MPDRNAERQEAQRLRDLSDPLEKVKQGKEYLEKTGQGHTDAPEVTSVILGNLDRVIEEAEKARGKR